MSREAQIKRLTRTQKEVLIASVDNSALCK